MLVHCEARAECGNEECVHYEQHELGEVESLLSSGKLITSPCEFVYCYYLSNTRGTLESECGCVPIGDEEDIE